MEFDLFSCTFENLSSLKFNELQKLSARFHVNKRWAKKREIIDKLLLLRDQEIMKKRSPCSTQKSDTIQENIEWVDGSEAFVTKDVDPGPECDENDRRLTYSISKIEPDAEERRLTYKVEKAENLISNQMNYSNFDRRLTYNVDDVKSNNKHFISQNYPAMKDTEIFPSSKVIEENEQHGLKDEMSANNTETSEQTKNESSIVNSQAQSKRCLESGSSKIKMLTIPYSRISNHNNLRMKMKNIKSDGTKTSENPSNIKKPINGLTANVKTIAITEQINSSDTHKDISSVNSSGIKKNVSKVSTKLSNNSTVNIKNEILKAKTCKSALPRRKSKTEDNVLVKNFKPSKNLVFYSPRESEMKNLRRLTKPNVLDLDLTCRSKIPKAKPAVSTQKPITATKMPDFSKIHQRRFEQMDSLIDYIKKKEDRAKKLLGLSQPGIPIKDNKNDVSKIFQFKSSHNEKENKVTKSIDPLKKDTVKNIKGNNEKSNRKDVLIRAGSKPDIVMSLKEQNRKHLHGVRTNKRFELQMKSRKL